MGYIQNGLFGGLKGPEWFFNKAELAKQEIFKKDATTTPAKINEFLEVCFVSLNFLICYKLIFPIAKLFYSNNALLEAAREQFVGGKCIFIYVFNFQANRSRFSLNYFRGLIGFTTPEVTVCLDDPAVARAYIHGIINKELTNAKVYI